MTDLLRQMRVHHTNERAPDNFAGMESWRPRAGLLEETLDSAPEKHPDIYFSQRHHLSVRIGVEFSANHVMLDRQLEIARRQLIRALYGEILALTDDAMSCVMGGDREGAIRILADMRKRMTGGEL